MAMNFLDFEAPIAELEAKIDELKFVSSDAEVNIADEIARLRAKSRALTTSIFSNLTQWQIAQLARHPQRPYTLDYVGAIFTDFQELHGDRMYSDDHAIVGGPARLDGMPVMIVGQQKGRDTKERVRRNYGMPKPEGYRKALRLMRMAERFQLPLITFIDTSGAYPGVGAEERGQSEAIARNLFEMSTLRTPIVSIVIGEGGSGGALAIGVGDRLLMLQYSIYSVISPEGCAGILWRSADKKDLAAEAMGVSAERIAKLGIVDEVVKEPLGGAHRDPQVMADTVKDALLRHLGELQALSLDQVVEKRQERLRKLRGVQRGIVFSPSALLACVESLVPAPARSCVSRSAAGSIRRSCCTVWLVLWSIVRTTACARRTSIISCNRIPGVGASAVAESRSRCRSNSFRWSSVSPRILS
jgi:acetyl-CoA carboxylase carboxyl transferase subunit alpha